MKTIKTITVIKLGVGVLLSAIMMTTAGCPGKSKSSNRGGAVGPGGTFPTSGCSTNCGHVASQSNRMGLYMANNTSIGAQITVELFNNNSGIEASGIFRVMGNIQCTNGPAIPPGLYTITQTIQYGSIPNPVTGDIFGLVVRATNGVYALDIGLHDLKRYATTGGSYVSCDGHDMFQEMGITSVRFESVLLNGYQYFCNNSFYADLGTQGNIQCAGY